MEQPQLGDLYTITMVIPTNAGLLETQVSLSGRPPPPMRPCWWVAPTGCTRTGGHPMWYTSPWKDLFSEADGSVFFLGGGNLRVSLNLDYVNKLISLKN